MRRSICCAVATAIVLPVLAIAPASAEEATGGVITGSAWLDRNRDGIRQADEAPVAGFNFLLPRQPGRDTFYVATTDENGNYRFEGLPPGEYVMKPFNFRDDIDFTRSGRDSDFDPCTGSTAVFTVPENGQVGPIDAGFIRSRHDVAAGAITVPPLPVGTEVDIQFELSNRGNVPELMWGQAMFPTGLTPVSATGYYPVVAGQDIHVGNMFAPRTCAGDTVSVQVRARVDAPIAGGELRVEAQHRLFAPDVRPRNNVKIKVINTQ